MAKNRSPLRRKSGSDDDDDDESDRNRGSESDSDDDDVSLRKSRRGGGEGRGQGITRGGEKTSDKEERKQHHQHHHHQTQMKAKGSTTDTKDGKKNKGRQQVSDDSDDMSPSSPSPVPRSTDQENEDDDDDDDRDEWRASNRRVSSKQLSDSRYLAQAEKWKKFRNDFPLPLKQSLSAGAILALRRQLKEKKKLVIMGIPIDLRRDVWELLSGARAFPEKLENHAAYQTFLSRTPSNTIMKQIKADASRALRGHLKYSTKQGQTELIHVLSAFAARSPVIGYVNSMSHIAAFLLLFYPEERAFWLLCTLIDIILPPDYYSSSLLGVRADAQLLKILVFQRQPRLHSHLKKFNLDVSVLVLKWLMPLFLVTLPIHVCIRIFDILMLEGSTFLISIALALMIIHSKKLCSLTDEGELSEYISKIGEDEKSIDSDSLITMAFSSKCMIGEEELKRREVERRIMESAYIKELQISQKYRRQEEERKKREEEEMKKELENEMIALSYGTQMWKIGRQGKPRQTKVYLRNETPNQLDDEKRIYTITWDSKNKKPGESRLLLRDCSLFLGVKHGQFAHRPDVCKQFMSQSSTAFSIISPIRSLDLVCLTQFDYDEWMKVLMRIPMREKETIRVNKTPLKNKNISHTNSRQHSRNGIGGDNDDDDHDEGDDDEKHVGGHRTLAELRAARGSGGGVSSSSVALPSSATAKSKIVANNKLTALLKQAPPPSRANNAETNSDDDDSPGVRRRKRN